MGSCTLSVTLPWLSLENHEQVFLLTDAADSEFEAGGWTSVSQGWRVGEMPTAANAPQSVPFPTPKVQPPRQTEPASSAKRAPGQSRGIVSAHNSSCLHKDGGIEHEKKKTQGKAHSTFFTFSGPAETADHEIHGKYHSKAVWGNAFKSVKTQSR